MRFYDLNKEGRKGWGEDEKRRVSVQKDGWGGGGGGGGW